MILHREAQVSYGISISTKRKCIKTERLLYKTTCKNMQN